MPGGEEALERLARAVDHAERGVARSGQLGRRLDDALEQGVERELGAERDPRLDERVQTYVRTRPDRHPVYSALRRSSSPPPSPPRPLHGIRVVDVTSSLAGPYCTQLLAALGADVVKVEHPGRGDEARAWGPEFSAGGSVLFFAANAGKRSLALDLKAPAGRDALLRLVDRADVLVQSLRPGTAERLGLGETALRGRNPRLVYASIGSYGRTGPLATLPGYDPMMQAAAGLISVTGEPGRPGVRVGASLVDQGTGLWAAFGILAALHEREQSGRGRVVDVSLYETAVALLPYHVAHYLATGEVPVRQGPRSR